MADATLRDAERRWREGGRLEDRLRWWSARARAGDLPAGAPALVVEVTEGRLDAARVELAAYLGDPLAQALALDEVAERLAYGGADAVLRVVTGEPDLRLDEVLAWIDALRLWERAAVERALIEATRHVADHLGGIDLSRADDEHEPLIASHREAERDQGLALTREALAAVERYLARPDDEPAALRAASQASAGFWPYVGPVVVAAATVARFVLARRGLDEHAPAGASDDALLAWRDTVRRSLPEPRDLRDAVRDALVPWALGRAGEAP